MYFLNSGNAEIIISKIMSGEPNWVKLDEKSKRLTLITSVVLLQGQTAHREFHHTSL